MDIITEQRTKIENRLIAICPSRKVKASILAEIDVLCGLIKAKTIEEIDCAAVCRIRDECF